MAFLNFLKENRSFFQYEITSWFGGKYNIAPQFIHPEILRAYNLQPFHTYTEAFSGMFWSGLLLPYEHMPLLKKIVYNDLNDLNANLFLCIKHYEPFLAFLRNMGFENNSNVFNEFKSMIFDPLFRARLDPEYPDFEAAYMYLYVMSNAYNGMVRETTSFNRKVINNGRFNALMNKLDNPVWKSRIERITDIGALDYKDIIYLYDSPETFHYIDSPYEGKEHLYPRHNFTRNSHEELKEVMTNIQGRFAISYYYFKELEEYYPRGQYNWKAGDFNKPSSKKIGAKGTEILIMNF